MEENHAMAVVVQFHGMHRMVTHTDEIRVPVTTGACVQDIMGYVNGRYPDLGLGEGKVFVLVNNKLSGLDQRLSPNDKITFLPPVGGG